MCDLRYVLAILLSIYGSMLTAPLTTDLNNLFAAEVKSPREQLTSPNEGKPSSPPPPNILFILADDLGWADTTLYGKTSYYKTPNLERLAKRGMTFTRAYSASPLCSPTRSAILTGLSPARTGITTPNCHLPNVVLKATAAKQASPLQKSTGLNTVSRLKTDYVTLPKTLRAAGYATGHFGKWHLGRTPYSPLEHGFDVDLPHWHGPGPAGSYVAPWKFDNFDHDPDVPDEHIEDRMAKEAVKWLKAHKDEPFFLNYWMFSVHAPFDAKKALIKKYERTLDKANHQQCPTYAAMIESMDDAIGTLLDSLDKLNLASNTIIVFTSDNGGNMYNDVYGVPPTSNYPLKGGKASMYEGGIRVPCVAVWPGVIEENTTCDVLVQSEDFFPTIMEATNLLPEPGQVGDGVSLMQAWRTGKQKHPPIFTYFPHSPPVPEWIPPSVAVHDGDWKLIRIFHHGENGNHRYQLFNLKKDIGETKNLAKMNVAKVKELDALIENFLVETKAVVPLKNPLFDATKYDPSLEGKPKLRKKVKPDTVRSVPHLKGWKARNCQTVVEKGILKITPTSKKEPFLGVAQPLNGPAKLTVRIKNREEAECKIQWIPSKGKPGEMKFQLKGQIWEDHEINLPEKFGPGILRVYLPAKLQKSEIDWVKIIQGKITKEWDF